jgi:hypothetical protein
MRRTKGTTTGTIKHDRANERARIYAQPQQRRRPWQLQREQEQRQVRHREQTREPARATGPVQAMSTIKQMNGLAHMRNPSGGGGHGSYSESGSSGGCDTKNKQGSQHERQDRCEQELVRTNERGPA